MQRTIQHLLFLVKCITLLGSFLSFSCRPVSKTKNDEILRNEKINDLKYLVNYIDNYSNNNKINIDSFNILYKSLLSYNVNDTIILLSSYFKDKKFIIITKDSIYIYVRSEHGLNYLSDKISDILRKSSNVDSVLTTAEKELDVIVYKYKLDDNFLVLWGFNNNNSHCFFLYKNRKDWWISAYHFRKAIKNKFISLGKLHFINMWPYNIDSVKHINLEYLRR
jgi:hypothetical protein